MKNPREHIAVTVLLLCAVLSAFYSRSAALRPTSAIPVEKVFAAVSASPAPLSLRQQREQERSQEIAALTELSRQDAQAAERLRELLQTVETERAVEEALLAMGYAQAVCVLRNGAATLCVAGSLNAEKAQALTELCVHMTGISADRVFILDECAYL